MERESEGGSERGRRGDEERFNISTFYLGQCGIQYETQAFQHGRMTFLQCPLSAPVKWWRSTEPCSGFSDYSAVCDTTSCGIYVNSSYFYYCCTAATVSDVLAVADVERGCFRIHG